ncbi:AEC family transporter [Marinomonas sp. PE14-40]|uniref:AEC family transporter n=1 Tax=Marinomonas sp. PE14-40 TaxID=3060621 RepID=UPI003F67DAD3
MESFLSVLNFSVSITLPIFFILALGALLSYLRMINDNFIDVASKLVFNITLPALLFISIVKTDLTQSTDFSLPIFAVTCVFILFLVFEFLSAKLVTNKADRGVIVQGAFRSNMGIIGLAYCVNAYGDSVFSIASIYLGSVTVLFNILSVITLNRSFNKQANITNTLKGIIKNPLIISIVSATIISSLEINLPESLLKTGGYFAQMTLPLALLCAGATLSFSALKNDLPLSSMASIGKLIIKPLVLTLAGILWGFRGMELGVIFLMSSAPSASAGYIMVRAMSGNAKLAANIIVLTTMFSLISTSIGITLLRTYGLI